MMRAARRALLLLVASSSLVACASTDAVILRHQRTGAVVHCGPYETNFWGHVGASIYQQERDCIADYQRQGYERAPR